MIGSCLCLVLFFPGFIKVVFTLIAFAGKVARFRISREHRIQSYVSNCTMLFDHTVQGSSCCLHKCTFCSNAVQHSECQRYIFLLRERRSPFWQFWNEHLVAISRWVYRPATGNSVYAANMLLCNEMTVTYEQLSLWLRTNGCLFVVLR